MMKMFVARSKWPEDKVDLLEQAILDCKTWPEIAVAVGRSEASCRSAAAKYGIVSNNIGIKPSIRNDTTEWLPKDDPLIKALHKYHGNRAEQ